MNYTHANIPLDMLLIALRHVIVALGLHLHLPTSFPTARGMDLDTCRIMVGRTDRPIQAIKALRDVLDLGLLDAKRIYDACKAYANEAAVAGPDYDRLLGAANAYAQNASEINEINLRMTARVEHARGDARAEFALQMLDTVVGARRDAAEKAAAEKARVEATLAPEGSWWVEAPA